MYPYQTAVGQDGYRSRKKATSFMLWYLIFFYLCPEINAKSGKS